MAELILLAGFVYGLTDMIEKLWNIKDCHYSVG